MDSSAKHRVPAAHKHSRLKCRCQCSHVRSCGQRPEVAQSRAPAELSAGSARLSGGVASRYGGLCEPEGPGLAPADSPWADIRVYNASVVGTCTQIWDADRWRILITDKCAATFKKWRDKGESPRVDRCRSLRLTILTPKPQGLRFKLRKRSPGKKRTI